MHYRLAVLRRVRHGSARDAHWPIDLVGATGSQRVGNLSGGAVEAWTLYGLEIHIRHLRRLIGDGFRLQSLQLDDLQDYVQRRSHDKGLRGRKVTTATIKKELVTFRGLRRRSDRHYARL